MKYIIQFLLCFFAFTSIAQSSQEGAVESFEDQLKVKSTSLLKECITYKESVGTSAGIYMDGKVVWTDGVGLMDMENKKPANADMIHRIASITKPMTAIAILQLVEQGLLELDDPIQKHIPDFPVKEEGAITIKHLLQHSSGIKAYKNDKEGFPTKNYATLSDGVDLFKVRDLANKPGEGFQYTTYGYVVLGLVIEKVSGLSYRDYMHENIWKKAGMVDTDVEVFGKTHPRKSKLYKLNKKGKYKNAKSTNLSVKVPGGGLQSTATDLLKFAEAVLENKLISAESLDLMIINSGLKKVGNPYAMGWFLYAEKDSPSGRVIGHSGGQSGTSTHLNIFLDKKAATAVISNTGGTMGVATLTSNLGQILVQPENVNKPIKKPTYVSNEILDRYIGKYNVGTNTVVELSRKGNDFYGEIKGVGKSIIYPESDTHFYLRSPNMQLEFESSTEKAESFTLIQNGVRHLASKK